MNINRINLYKRMSSILHRDIWFIIFGHIDNLINCKRVNKFFNEIVKSILTLYKSRRIISITFDNTKAPKYKKFLDIFMISLCLGYRWDYAYKFDSIIHDL